MLLMERATVIVGRKKAIRYVTACITLFNRGEREIVLRARGRLSLIHISEPTRPY